MVVTLTKHNVKEIVDQTEKPVVVDIFATWRGPCMLIKPHFEQLAEELSDKYIFAQLMWTNHAMWQLALTSLLFPRSFLLKTKMLWAVR